MYGALNGVQNQNKSAPYLRDSSREPNSTKTRSKNRLLTQKHSQKKNPETDNKLNH